MFGFCWFRELEKALSNSAAWADTTCNNLDLQTSVQDVTKKTKELYQAMQVRGERVTGMLNNRTVSIALVQCIF